MLKIWFQIFIFTFWLLSCFGFGVGNNGFGLGFLSVTVFKNKLLTSYRFVHHINLFIIWTLPGCFVLGFSKMGFGQAEQHCTLCSHFLLIWNQFVHHISIIQRSNFALYVFGFSKKGLGQAEQHCTLFVHISKCLYSTVQLPGATLASVSVGFYFGWVVLCQCGGLCQVEVSLIFL